MPNYYKTSAGEKVSAATVKSRRSKAYRKMYEGEPHPPCSGCGAPAQGSAHLVPQKVLGDLGKIEYCWLPINIVPACHICNSLLESYKSEEVKELMCYPQLLEVTKLIAPERYLLMTL